MNRYKQIWRELIHRAVEEESGKKIDPADVIIEIPPRAELGDLAFPMFPYAPHLKSSPRDITRRVAERLRRKDPAASARIEIQGPYLNIHLDRLSVTSGVIAEILKSVQLYGRGESLEGQRIVLEFSCPNTNKPLHLGHLRNDAVGMSIEKILSSLGAEVLKVNLINDRGVHICKSMLAYQHFGDGITPEERGQKGDHLVGDFYVRFTEWAKENPNAEELARKMLKSWEEEDPKVRELWERMNRWAIEGIEETYIKTGVRFDKIYLESQTYLLGRKIVKAGLEKGVFYKESDGSVWVDLSAEKLDKKVLLRSDGTSLYLTQDLGTAVQRYQDWPFERMIYIVGNEQRYHFQVLFKILELLGYDWAENLYHLAYGMVNLPEGKMKSREGTVVDADDLIEDLERLAAEETFEKDRQTEAGDLKLTAEKIALGALNYYLLQPSPLKDMIFDPKESLSFSGSTGPYLQYTGARISSMLRKFNDRKLEFQGGVFKPELLTQSDEWSIVKQMASYPESVIQAARELNPSIVTTALFELAQTFSHYYHDNPVLHNENPDLVVSRITLTQAVRQVLANGMDLIGVPFLDRM
ncbi:Arginine--tRNA ligase [subsurface metagenome]